MRSTPRWSIPTAGGFALVLLTVASCSTDPSQSTAAETTSSSVEDLISAGLPPEADERDTVELDGLAEGADDVFVQIGQYELGNNIDEFVWGPLLVAYRDGSAFAEVDETVIDGVAERRPIEALLDPAQIDSIRQAADALPDDTEIGLDQRAEDAIPRMLIVDDQTWLIHDLSAEPFRSFMESVTEAVEATEVDQWTPQRWVERDRSTGQCSVTQAPSGPSYDNAPVYPHLLDQYPLGDFDCSS